MMSKRVTNLIGVRLHRHLRRFKLWRWIDKKLPYWQPDPYGRPAINPAYIPPKVDGVRRDQIRDKYIDRVNFYGQGQ